MKNNILVLAAATFTFTSCTSQKSVSVSSKPEEAAEITKYMNTITAEDLKTHLYIVASDEMQGRNTGEEGQKKAGKYLIEQYTKNGISFPTGASDFYQPIPASYFQKAFSPKLGDSENIWAFIEGSEKPEEILVISAHYDHVGMKNGEIYNGADDDGSGTVALLEIAQAFQQAKKEGKGPKRSILFLHVTGEEHGLHGSRFYTENPLFPLAKTITDINIDMIGRRDALHKDSNNYVYVIGSDYLSSDLYNITEEANKQFVNLKLDYKYNDRNDPNRFYYRSDHYNFAKHNIPSVFFFNGTHEDYHQPGDEAHKIEYDALAKRTQLAFAVAWELANRADRPVVDKSGSNNANGCHSAAVIVSTFIITFKKDNFKTQPIMMRTLLYAAILLPFYSSCTSNSASSDVLTETEVKDFVAAYDQSWSTRDTLKLKELLDDDYIYFSSVGSTSDKKESIAMFAPANNYTIAQSVRKEIKVILNGNTAVVNSHWIGNGSFKGTAFNDDQRCGIILKKTNDKISIISENCVQISQH